MLLEAWEQWVVGGVPRARDLVHGESVIATQGGVGMYAGDHKVPSMGAGTAVLTTHRLAYVDAHHPLEHSAFVRMARIRESEHYAGFLRSSPKIVLKCVCEPPTAWHCALCGTRHESLALDQRCTLCGVTMQEAPPPPRACTACTFLNHADMRHCEICDTPLPMQAPLAACKLSFRLGGDRAFYNSLRDTLQTKPWKAAAEPGRAPAAGLVAVESAGTSTTTSATAALSAFDDLDALMRQARHMVNLAESLRAELDRHDKGQAPSGASSLLQSALVRIGLPNPAITPDMVKSERAYHRELACELAGVLLGEQGLLGPGRVVRDGAPSTEKLARTDTAGRLLPLDEVWGLWNRARGVALVSPKLLRAAAAYLPDVTDPCVRLRTLRSGTTVLHTPRFDDAAVEARVLAYLDDATCLTTTQVAARECMPAPLVRELLECVESSTGAIVRDECGTQETRWFRNSFPIPSS